MPELSLLDKLRRKVREVQHRVRVALNPNPTDEERAELHRKDHARAQKQAKSEAKNIRGGTNTGWSDESTTGFGGTIFPTLLGRSESSLGIDYQNPNARNVSTVDLRLGDKK
jgi:hypothetical protein